MLIEKNIEPNDIVVIKLVTQEEIIAKLVSNDIGKITIQRPMTIALGMDERTMKPGIQMLPFYLLGAEPDAKLTIENQHVITKTLANSDIKKNYMSATSGLAMPNMGKGMIG